MLKTNVTCLYKVKNYSLVFFVFITSCHNELYGTPHYGTLQSLYDTVAINGCLAS